MLTIAGIIVVAAPVLLLAVLGIATLLRIKLSERTIARFTEASGLIGLIASLCILAVMLATNERNFPVEVGDWVSIPANHVDPTSESPGESPIPHAHRHVIGEEPHGDADGGEALVASPSSQEPAEPNHANHFHFRMKFVFDRLSVPFVIMTFVLCGVIGAFASKYLHREEGFHRFFMYFSFFQLGMILSSVAGTIETLFFGWELVGLSSALLIAFYHDRRSPVANGMRVWSVYRIADAAFLVAALSLHHLSGSGDFDGIAGKGGDWPHGQAVLEEGSALFVGCLLLFAAAGKSALVPFSGWLPRAMEGPTPSSAVFYGALSVHLGAFLLLRVSPLLNESLTLQVLVVCLGLTTMIFAAMAAQVQSDVKTSLAFASLIQVSIIVVEIGFGLRYIPLIHIIGHACLRTLQLIRAPSLLRDYNSMINAIGEYLPDQSVGAGRVSPSMGSRLYRFAFDRGNLDSILDEYFVRPFVLIFQWSDRMERRWTTWLSGTSIEPVDDLDGQNGDS